MTTILFFYCLRIYRFSFSIIHVEQKRDDHVYLRHSALVGIEYLGSDLFVCKNAGNIVRFIRILFEWSPYCTGNTNYSGKHWIKHLLISGFAVHSDVTHLKLPVTRQIQNGAVLEQIGLKITHRISFGVLSWPPWKPNLCFLDFVTDKVIGNWLLLKLPSEGVMWRWPPQTVYTLSFWLRGRAAAIYKI